MPVFASKKFPSKAHANTIASRYRSALSKHPFLLFGFPFIATMVAGSFFLTPATAIRYEKHDRRVRRMTKEEELGIGKSGRRVDMNEEYYVSAWTRKIFGRELMLCAETCSEGPGWLGTEACQETSRRTRRCDIISGKGEVRRRKRSCLHTAKLRQDRVSTSRSNQRPNLRSQTPMARFASRHAGCRVNYADLRHTLSDGMMVRIRMWKDQKSRMRRGGSTLIQYICS